jgi:hypothetical protein
MESFDPLAPIMGAARRLAVDGDQIVPAGPEFLDPALKTMPEQLRVKPIDKRLQPADAWDPMMKRRKSAQKIQVMLAPCDDVIKVVTSSDGGACQQEEDFRQRIGDPPWLSSVRKLREMLEENGHPRSRHLLDKNCIHVRDLPRISACGE